MAGSELDGLDGADAAMFSGATWVLTPVVGTDDATFATVASVVGSARRRGRGDDAAAPRRDGRRRQPRAAPHGGEPDGRRRRSGRGARRPAAPRRRRLPRHDPRRQRPARHLARRLRREPPGDPVGDGRPHRAARPRSARSSAPTTATPSTPASAGPATPAPTCPSTPDTRRSWPRCASRSPTAPGAAAEIFTLAAELGVNIASFEVVHLAESNVGVAVVLVDAEVAELYRGGLIARGYRPAVTAPELTWRDDAPPHRGSAPARRRRRRARLEEHRQPGPRLRRPRRRRQPAASGCRDGDDTVAMVSCLQALGIGVTMRGRRRRRRRQRRRDRHGRCRPRRQARPARRRASSPPSPRWPPDRSPSTAHRPCGVARWARCTTPSPPSA